MKKSFIALSLAASLALADGSYTLGKVSVQAGNTENINMIEQTITSVDIAQNNERTIAESLDNVSGVSMNDSGPRGEAKVSIRGQSASRIGIFIDGIPVYVPYDGNFDFGRFLTNDIAEIDISKGFSSIAYGANTMGGVVNIVTKKPTKELEGNIRGEIILDSDAKIARHLESINVGSRVGNFYAQLGGSYTKRDHFRMSNSYSPVAGSEQEKGDRFRSQARDQKISLKVGYIADDASEIALSYAKQEGQKQHPVEVNPNPRHMDSPFWDKETFSISGQKNFASSYIKALAYYDKSENTMYFYKNKTYTTLQFDPSYYDDYSYGARIEYGLEVGGNFLKLAANYKKDVHQDIDLFTNVLSKKYEDHTISLGAEDTYKVTNDLEILAGISYDRQRADKAYENTSNAYVGLDTMSAVNPQAAIIYTLTSESKLRVSASQKTYLPSMKDRFSGGMGKKEPNPDLDKEISTNYEIGYTYKTKEFFIATNAYFTQVKDAISSVKTNTLQDGSTTKYKDQNQNIGDFEHIGFEIDAAYTLDNTKVGGNFAFIDVQGKNESSEKRTNIPKHQAFAFAQQKLGAGFSIYANIKYRNGAYDQDDNYNYVKIGSFTTFDAKVIYEPMKELLLEVGVKNLTDRLVEYSFGYPEAGREYFATLNYKF